MSKQNLTKEELKHYLKNTKNTKQTKQVQTKEINTGKNTLYLLEQKLVLI